MELHLTATECHLPYGITQCYLPPDTSEHIPPSPQPDRLVLSDKTFSVAGPRARNSLPTSVQLTATKSTFCKHLKTHMLRVSYGHLSYSVFIYRFYWVTCTAPVIIGNWRTSKCVLLIFIDWLIDWWSDCACNWCTGIEGDWSSDERLHETLGTSCTVWLAGPAAERHGEAWSFTWSNTQQICHPRWSVTSSIHTLCCCSSHIMAARQLS